MPRAHRHSHTKGANSWCPPSTYHPAQPPRTRAHGCMVAARHPGTGHLHGECWLVLRHKDAAQHTGQRGKPLKPLQPLLLLWAPCHPCQLLLHLLSPDLQCAQVAVGGLLILGPLPELPTLTRSSRSWDTPFRAVGGVAGGVAGSAGFRDPGLLGSAVRRTRSLRAFSIWAGSEGRGQKIPPLLQHRGGPSYPGCMAPAESLYVQPRPSQGIRAPARAPGQSLPVGSVPSWRGWVSPAQGPQRTDIPTQPHPG